MTADACSEIQVSPFYYEAKNEIIQPNHFVACSRYFVQKWMPKLGGTAVSMILYLRSQGYYNPLTGERRNGIQVSLRDIAEACGCSDRTIQRELDKNEALQGFIHVEPCFSRSRDGQAHRLENIYYIAMDDPIAPEDEERLAEIIAGRGNNPTAGADSWLSAAGRNTPIKSVSPAAIAQTPITASRPGVTAQASTTSSRPAAGNQASTASSRPAAIGHCESIIPPPPGDKLSLPSRHIVATPVTECLRNSPDKLSSQASIQNIPISLLNNNTPPARISPQAMTGSSQEVIVVALIACGVSEKTARQLAAEYSHDDIQKQIAALPHRKPQDPGAVLVSSIRGGWELPAAYLAAEKEKVAKAAQLQQATRSREERQAQIALNEEKTRHIQAYWDGLDKAEQEAIEVAAREIIRRENAFMARRLEKGAGGGAVQQVLKDPRERVMLERMGDDCL